MRKFALSGVLLLILAPMAQATSISFQFTSDHCTGGCGTPSFGTITLTQTDTSHVHIDFTLAPAVEGFVNTGSGEALAFDISGHPAISISNLTDGFSTGGTAGGANLHTGGTGNFDYWIHCSDCGHGGSDPSDAPISFNVSLISGSNLSISDFVPNAADYYFGSDIMGSTGRTGSIGATGPAAAVPEPASLILLGSGLTALGVWKRRKK